MFRCPQTANLQFSEVANRVRKLALQVICFEANTCYSAIAVTSDSVPQTYTFVFHPLCVLYPPLVVQGLC
jgi:hypothetical protein